MQTTDMRRRFTREFKLGVVRQIDLGLKTKAQTCREHGLSPSLLDRWCEKVKEKGEAAFKDPKEPSPEQRIKELEASLGRAHLELEFMKEALSILRNPERKSP